MTPETLPTPTRWIDLSSYDYKAGIIKTPTGRHSVVLQGGFTQMDIDRLKSLRFKIVNTANDTTLMKLEVDNAHATTAVVEKLRRQFPKSIPIDFDMGSHYFDRSNAAQMKNVEASRVVGRNRRDVKILEDSAGRRFSLAGGSEVREDPDAPSSMFLRASTYEDLVECAEGFLLDVLPAATSTVVARDVFVARTASDPRIQFKLGQETPKAFRDAIDIVLKRRQGGVLQNMFMESVRLVDRSPASEDRSRHHPAVEIAVQRCIGIGGKLVSGSVHVLSGKSRFDTMASADVGYVEGSEKADAVVLDLSGQPFLEASETAWESIQSLRDDTVATILLSEPSTPDEQASLELLRRRLGTNHHFEGEALVDGVLLDPSAAAKTAMRPESSARPKGMLVLSVGGRLAEPDPMGLPPLPHDVSSWGKLWTFTAEVLGVRTGRDAVVDTVVGGYLAAAGNDRNQMQAPYRAASRVGEPSKMVPINLETASIQALDTLVNRYGDIDEMVAAEFGYPVEDLGDLFTPEQVDALASWVYADERGRAFLLADDTGVGKGRTLAAVMRWSALHGRKTLFVTEKEKNLSDIWRDIRATRSEEILKTVVLNTDSRIIDPITNEIVMRGLPAGGADFVEAGIWPEDCMLILSTYTQFNADPDKPSLASTDAAERSQVVKSRWIRSAVGPDTTLVLDESHNAAGDSNVSHNIVRARDAAANTCYSSATFASDIKRMSFYAPLFPDNLNMIDLENMLKKGGQPFQEVVTDMLVRDGVMVRREFDHSKNENRQILDERRLARNRSYTDALGAILSDMAKLTLAVDTAIATQNDAQRVRNKTSPYFVTRSGQGSPLHTISRIFIAALKTDVCVEKAIEALEADQKPVIMVENTLEGLMNEIAAERPGDAEVKVTMRDVLRQIVRRTVTTTHKAVDKKVVLNNLTERHPEIAAAAAAVISRIDAFPELSVSIIDDVKRRIEEAGWTCDEITGRSIAIENGRFVRRSTSNSVVTKNLFNSGEIDAIIINASGATGIDLHASSTFADQRQRNFMELQPHQDVTKKMQGRGRVNRQDQVVDPVYTSFETGLPAEMRLNAMENARLRSMSANTTSNRDSRHLVRNTPDLINPVGDLVCQRYAEMNPDLMRRLGFDVSVISDVASRNLKIDMETDSEFGGLLKVRNGRKVDDTRVTDTRRTASEFLSRIIMLPVDEQTRVYDELIAEFRAVVEEMEAKNQTPLKSFELPGVVHVRKKTVFSGASVAESTSVFDEPLNSLSGALERVNDALKSDDILSLIEIGEMSSGRRQVCIDRIRNGIDDFLGVYLPEGVASVADAVEKNVRIVVEKKNRLDKIAGLLEQMEPGNEVEIVISDDRKKAMVTRIDYPPVGREGIATLYGVEMVVAGEESPRRMSMAAFLDDVKVHPGLKAADYEEVLKRYDNAAVVRLTDVTILVDNIFKAMRMNVMHQLGALSLIRYSDGRVDRGVVLSGRQRGFKSVPVELDTCEMARQALFGEGLEISGVSSIRDRTFFLKYDPDTRTVKARLPNRTRRSEVLWSLASVAGFADRIVALKSGSEVTISRREAEDMLQEYYAVNGRFWAPPEAQNFMIDWHQKKLAENVQGNDDRPAMAPAA